jgi:oligopeptide/dipeptide ABC transporter ATP-binding protein
VGESGCGKTTMAQAILGLTQKTAGTIRLAIGAYKNTGVDFDEIDKEEKRNLRRAMQVIFQDPFSSLNPRMTVRSILEEPLIVHDLGNRKSRNAQIAKLLDNVGMTQDSMNRYPHEFSGGQRQRIGIARALACNPELVIADEPVSALDVSIRAQIINLLLDLKSQYNQTLLIISHDLAVVRHMADRIAVMYLGRIMESGTCDQIFSNPLHPYTKTLLSSIPVVGKGRQRKTEALTDEKLPAAGLSGCPFYPRCVHRCVACEMPDIPLSDSGNGHHVACVLSPRPA